MAHSFNIILFRYAHVFGLSAFFAVPWRMVAIALSCCDCKYARNTQLSAFFFFLNTTLVHGENDVCFNDV